MKFDISTLTAAPTKWYDSAWGDRPVKPGESHSEMGSSCLAVKARKGVPPSVNYLMAGWT